MQFIADFHLHSRFSRATSKDMDAPTIARWARLKGIKVVGTGDFTHPTHLASLKARLESDGSGLYHSREGDNWTKFILTGEVSNIFSQGGKVRKIHTLIFAPSFQVVDAINDRLARLGKLSSDGRPIFGFPVKDLVKLVLDVSEACLVVPAHAWTPWFSLFGANSGFDSIEECFGEEARHIHAIETGLSSDPQMNWRLSCLDEITLISNSDAHSPSKIGREANVFDCDLSYEEITSAIRKKDKKKFVYTIEFFPEEGKYHFDGHRACGILFSPEESKKHNLICPRCGRRLTLGVMHRVNQLADRPPGFIPQNAIPARHLVPLVEIVADCLSLGVGSAAVEREYERITMAGGNECEVLLSLDESGLSRIASPRIVEGILKVRRGEVNAVPGYDGVFGKISIFGKEAVLEKLETVAAQTSLF
ncbi:MAG: endonuclease Q family protein [Candidatus Eisenbacteria bacterium]|nr:endonuclease Q family protein [Candidatus Eisenbacteria bacterium]